MEVSINTSKRKFQSLLENISNAAKNDPSSTQVQCERSSGSRPVKRSRLGQTSLQNDNGRSKLASLKGSRVTERATRRVDKDNVRYKESITTTSKRDSSSTGAYAPWSRDTFLERLRTFADPHLWSPKPEAINELQWAKRGWVCEDKNTVACKGMCEQRLVIDLDPSQLRDLEVENNDEDEEAHDIHKLEDSLTQKYRELIVDAHSEHCLWRKSGCKEDIYRLPLLRSGYWKSSLASRYEKLMLVADMLPNKLSINLPDELEQASAHLLSRSLELNSAKSRFSTTASKLAIFGWKGELVGEVAFARCESCFQRIGLWLYSVAEEENSNDNDDNSYDNRELLDPVASHKYYCPWINADNQYASNKYAEKAGWEILQDLILQNRIEPEDSQEAKVVVQEEQYDAISIDDKDNARLSKLQQLKKIFSFKKRSR